MKFVFLTYNNSPQFHQPADWLDRIRACTGIFEALSKRHSVVSIEQINFTGEREVKGVQYHFLNFGKKKLRFPFSLHRYVRGLRPDIVFVHGMHFPFQIIQLRLCLGPHVKIIVQHHAEKPGVRHTKFLQQIADGSIDAYLFAARELGLEWVTRHIIRNPAKIHEVMEASSVFFQADQSRARTFTGATGDPLFLWVGRLDTNKDPLTVIKAFLRYADLRPGARLYMIFHTEELLADIKALLDNRATHPSAVVLTGKVPHEEMAEWYNSADFILSGSHYEGSGVAVCEAMSCGCIPIVTDIASFRMITDNGRCGKLYEPGNETVLLKALEEITREDILTQRDKTLSQFKKRLSFEAIARGIEEVADSLNK